MIFNLKEFKEVCSKILTAVDSSDGSVITDTLSVEASNGVLSLSVTNKEYYTRVNISVGDLGEFKASVNADKFLKLVSSSTSETIELTVVDNLLKVVADGTFKFPLIFDGDSLLKLPEITIENKTQEFDVNAEDLMNILVYNSKEANKKTRFTVQRMYYLDNEGCITFTTGACVNKFSLGGEIKILLTAKVVKLFKLFTSSKVHLELGYDPLANGIIQAKVVFSTPDVVVSAIIPNDESLLSSVPASVIRSTAFADYPYSINLNKDAVLNAIKRFLIFTKDITKCVITFDFNDHLTISDEAGNSEEISYDTNSDAHYQYTVKLFAEDLRLTLESVNDKFVVFNFGNGRAVVIAKGNIYNVVPEVVVKDVN